MLAAALNWAPNDDGKLLVTTGFAEDRTVSQATHLDASALFTIMHVSHSQVLAAALNWLPNVFKGVGCSFTSDCSTFDGAAAWPGFGVSQATHLARVASFFSIQLSHSHWLDFGANIELSEGSDCFGSSAFLPMISMILPVLSWGGSGETTTGAFLATIVVVLGT